MYQKYGKRLLDIIISLTAFLILSPVMVLTALIIWVCIGSPVLFLQKRPGYQEKIFIMYKFRTMSNEKDEEGNLLKDSIRLTRLGKLLRATSLDELPELLNVLKGDMSIVGPRPQLVKDMVFMTVEQRKRHTVRQGLTGLAQINGRNNITWEQKLQYDLQYIEKITFIGDLKIIFKTIHKVLSSEGISADGMVTAEDLGEYLLRTNQIDEEQYLKRMKEVHSLLS